MNRKVYITPDMQMVMIDSQSVVAASTEALSEETVTDESDFVQYSRSYSLWDDEED